VFTVGVTGGGVTGFGVGVGVVGVVGATGVTGGVGVIVALACFAASA